MSDAYGAKFTSNYGDAPNSTWEAMLQPFTQEQIGEAFMMSLTDYPEWPPSLAQFIELTQGLNKAYLESLCVEPSGFDVAVGNMNESQIRKRAERARDWALAEIKRKLHLDPQAVHKETTLRLENKS